MGTGIVKSKFILQPLSIVFILIAAFWLQFCQKAPQYQILETPIPVVDASGQKREYKLFIPDTGKKTPLLVYFHGVMSDQFKNKAVLKNYTGSPVETTGLIKFCKINRITLLIPKAAYSYINLDCKAYGWSPYAKETDGVEKIIDTVIKNYNIDKREVYLSGISAGANFSNHLANRRPELYNSILSHSQGFTTEKNKQLEPKVKGPSFGVVICYTGGDWDNLKKICEDTYKVYKKSNYKTIILRNLSPSDHSWDNSSNRRFWRLLRKTGQYTGDVK